MSESGTKIVTIANLGFISRVNINEKKLEDISDHVCKNIWKPAMNTLKFKKSDWNDPNKRKKFTEILKRDYKRNTQKIKSTVFKTLT